MDKGVGGERSLRGCRPALVFSGASFCNSDIERSATSVASGSLFLVERRSGLREGLVFRLLIVFLFVHGGFWGGRGFVLL